MSIYEGIATEQDYAQGRTHGFMAGEDVPGSVAKAEIADWTAAARSSYRRSTRAYCLGYLRGYRDAVRTFERGRWGT